MIVDTQWLLAGGLVFLLVLYISTVFFFKRKEETIYRLQQRENMESTTEEPADFSVAINDWTEELFTEKGDRTYWYRISIFLENGESSEYDFYSYNNSLTKEYILKDRFYVNDHELLIVDEAGEHYINRKKIEQIDFLRRKILENQQAADANEEKKLERTTSDASSDFMLETEGIPAELLKELAADYTEKRVWENHKKSSEKPRLFSKNKKIKRPSIRKVEAKKVDRIFISIIVVILCSGLFALMRTFGIGAKVEKVSATQNRMTEQLDLQSMAMNTDGYPFEMNRFMQSFIDQYIPLSNDSSAMVERAEQLKNFCIEGVSFNQEVSSVKRVLVSSELSEVKKQDTFSTACYKVTYSLEIPKEQVRQVSGQNENEWETYLEYSWEEQTVYLAIDFIGEDGLFSIISYPYFKDLEQRKIETNELVRNELHDTAVNDEQIEEINQFLAIFYAKYAGGSREELSYLMDEAESLGGNFQLKDFELMEAFDQGTHFTVYSKANFTEEKSGFAHKENFSMQLIKENGQLKIKELTHNLGGF
ncbi:conjugal transfer protein [Enterococcus sp. BWB1-3]|uniref:conjugal transfer protein n=1 Tax=Enterococcus sp. BWB1-3 TaxID=2787713 RepID=UPI0019232D17|nr:conjugal transfer protein [Enterococcus sp. BWB1-3]MBL1228942.1 conjugal transfer protein [Enterococcus sp. BWB1-3]